MSVTGTARKSVLALALVALGFAILATKVDAVAGDPLAAIFAAQGNYMGSDSCLDCHGKAVKEPYEKTPMGHRFTAEPKSELEKKNCESCHGPGEKHADKPKVKGLILAFGHNNAFSGVVQNAACLQCHVSDPKRHWESPANFLAEKRCVDCHITMRPTGLVKAGQKLSPAELAQIQKEFAGQYAGDALCQRCHQPLMAGYDHTKHAHLLNAQAGRNDLERQGCEACHGPGKVHAYSGGGKGVGGMITFREKDRATVVRNNEKCLQCHQDDRRDYWDSAAHGMRNIACTSCHTLMERRSQKGQLSANTQMQVCAQCHQNKRSQMYRNSHMPVREGKMDCSTCHNPHGTQTQAMLKGDSPNDVCYTCHAEKRGPFLHEHPPVGENCMTCHDPHGSVRGKMLKLDPPRLCQTCHIETRHPTQAHVPGSRFVLERACLQCHQFIHGSNHPSGQNYTR